MMKIAVFGGTFDPPHLGHLIIAAETVRSCELDEVWFMPSPRPPHKSAAAVTDAAHRIEMVKRAVEGNKQFKLSLFEFQRDGLSYTYETMKALTARYPEHEWYFLIGADMVEDLPNWHNINELTDFVTFIAAGRPGFSLQSPFGHAIRFVEVPQIAISSSLLRKKFANQGNTKYLLPDNVRDYIMKEGLYG
ncbi:MAG TPA: nicotinate-nucleotide adenylyltransferase [Bacillales bacterium]|nr:nicotinate-nucleotide adenylyltransferase [Bacillales bacterium]